MLTAPDGLSPLLAAEVQQALELFAAVCPRASHHLREVTVAVAGEMSENGIARFDSSARRLLLNGNYWLNETRLRAAVRAEEARGWSPLGCASPGYIVMHELGHTLETFLFHTRQPGRSGEGRSAESHWREFIRRHRRAMAYVCLYARFSSGEAFAEAFASSFFTPREHRIPVVFQISAMLTRYPV